MTVAYTLYAATTTPEANKAVFGYPGVFTSQCNTAVGDWDTHSIARRHRYNTARAGASRAVRLVNT